MGKIALKISAQIVNYERLTAHKNWTFACNLNGEQFVKMLLKSGGKWGLESKCQFAKVKRKISF